ncbi:GNAT family N-acetyltransferase [Nakamurella endophytica]|uniref:N-acetyltransferase domain-containing protein n=1 Tax=Nakamurella endophytica TaxID=1748367 RepID=A0A917T0G3_9ACTN|nr:GNAT family protein [Nakamurella endophytica]GGM05870.1 hypothetical protein GCM10011594_27620 [Nakamurella endophytica]
MARVSVVVDDGTVALAQVWLTVRDARAAAGGGDADAAAAHPGRSDGTPEGPAGGSGPGPAAAEDVLDAGDDDEVAGDAAVVAPAEVDDDFAVDSDPRPLPVDVPGRSLVVLHRGAYAGAVSYIPVLHGPSYPCSAWMIGVYVDLAHRRQGVAAAAQRLLARHLFATTDLDRVEAETDVDNIGERKALERAGFRQEGVARGAQLRGGVRRDVATYAVLREDLQGS